MTLLQGHLGVSFPSYSWVKFCQLTQVFKDHGAGSTPVGSTWPPESMCVVDTSTAMSRTPGPDSQEWQSLPLLPDLAQMLTHLLDTNEPNKHTESLAATVGNAC